MTALDCSMDNGQKVYSILSLGGKRHESLLYSIVVLCPLVPDTLDKCLPESEKFITLTHLVISDYRGCFTSQGIGMLSGLFSKHCK